MTVPQPFQYQGSKRALALLILQYLPVGTTRLAGCAGPRLTGDGVVKVMVSAVQDWHSRALAAAGLGADGRSRRILKVSCRQNSPLLPASGWTFPLRKAGRGTL